MRIPLWLVPPKRFLSTAASVVGIAGGLNSLFGGGGGSGGPNPNQFMYYNPMQQQQAAQSWMDAGGTAGNNSTMFANMTMPSIMGGLKSGLGTDRSGMNALLPMLQGSYGNMANTDALYAQMLGQQAGTNMNALTSGGIGTYLNALDPQKQQHDRLLQGILDQSGAGQAQRGIQMGGVGQGMSDDASRKFEMDWSNNLLGRQVEGLTAMERALGTASQTGQNNLSAASGLWGAIPGAQMQQQMVPQQLAGMDMNFLAQMIGGYGGAFQNTQVSPFQQIQNQQIPFLSGGTGAGADAFGGALKSFQTQQQTNANGWNALLTGANQLGKTPTGTYLNSLWSPNTYTPTGNNPDAYSNMANA